LFCFLFIKLKKDDESNGWGGKKEKVYGKSSRIAVIKAIARQKKTGNKYDQGKRNSIEGNKD
jgi:hypothetical protein